MLFQEVNISLIIKTNAHLNKGGLLVQILEKDD